MVKKMKSGASPCPLDQISIIAFQKCPALRSQLLRIIHHCWRHKVLPSCWRNAVAVLAYKKGSPKDPSNFRPISLEPVLLKVYHYIIRNRLYIFKPFWSDISGTIEHTETLTYLLRHAKLKQRNLVVTLIDLKNAFGEVQHQFLRKTLSFHNITDSVIDLVMCAYDEFYLSITTKSFFTNPIKVDRGVLQGDCLSPLLFNLCINTLVNTVKNEKLNCFGYVYDFSFKPRNWF